MKENNDPAFRRVQAMGEEADLAIEEVLLLLLGVFCLVFGLSLFRILRGELAYSPDGAYGLLLVLVSLQVITMGKTPFGDLRRSWAVVFLGMGAAVFGMSASFVPGRLTGPIRLTVGIVLLAGGLSLLSQLLLSPEKARKWVRLDARLWWLAGGCGFVYLLSVALGVITLFPGSVPGLAAAWLLLAFGAGFFHLAWVIREVNRRKPPDEPASVGEGRGLPGRSRLAREASLSLSLAALLLFAMLLTVLGLVLVPVNLGLLPFSPDGLQGLLLILFALQMMALGDTPVGRYRRSWPMAGLGLAFALPGVFSSIVPGVLTQWLGTFLGLLNISAGAIFFVRSGLQKRRARSGAPAGPVPPLWRKLEKTQITLNVIVIAFGLSMFAPGLVPGLAKAVIIVANGALLFILASFLRKLESPGADG